MIALLQSRAVSDTINFKRTFDWQHVSDRLIQVGVILLASIILYQFVKVILKRIIAREIEEEDPLVKRLKEQRVQTLGSLFTNVLLVVMVTVTTLTILDVFINIGPLLASVSVVGLAVSFGAQSLVKDIISGTFMLIEGQFGIGDVVKVGDTAGMVEKITLRTTILRDLHGVVHIIPNGEITRVSNLTKTWSRAVLDVSVAYRVDIDQAIATLENIAAEFQADPEWGLLLIEPPEVPGVESLGDSGVVIRMTAKTLPLKQWDVARELRRRIKNRFAAEAIEIPYPHLTFYWGEGQLPPRSQSQAPSPEK
ncbi:MAG: mechanosensitive ion channel family protein [Gemmatimonadota bacterium]